MSQTNLEANCIINTVSGNGYAVLRETQLHKRAHLWRIEQHNHWHSIATFHNDDEALAFLRWLRERAGVS